MAHAKLLAVFLSVFVSIAARSQNDTALFDRYEGKHALYFLPADLFFGTFKVGYEIGFKNNSLVLLTGVLLKKDSRDNYKGLKGEVQFRKYLFMSDKKNTISSFYIAPLVTYAYIENNYTETSGSGYPVINIVVTQGRDIIKSLGAGVVIGIHNTIHKRIHISVNFGGGVKYTEVSGRESEFVNISSIGYTGIIPKMSIDIGYVL